MELKKCTTCKELHPVNSFAKDSSRGDGLQASCLTCSRTKSKKWHSKNYQRKKQQTYESTRRRVEFIQSLKEKPCTDCGVEYPHYVMHFDHLRDKCFNISHGMRNHALSTILKEIEKCELVCANCHSIRTWNRRVAKERGR